VALKASLSRANGIYDTTYRASASLPEFFGCRQPQVKIVSTIARRCTCSKSVAKSPRQVVIPARPSSNGHSRALAPAVLARAPSAITLPRSYRRSILRMDRRRPEVCNANWAILRAVGITIGIPLRSLRARRGYFCGSTLRRTLPRLPRKALPAPRRFALPFPAYRADSRTSEKNAHLSADILA
jgi:hypothetical protein